MLKKKGGGEFCDSDFRVRLINQRQGWRKMWLPTEGSAATRKFSVDRFTFWFLFNHSLLFGIKLTTNWLD